MTRSLGGLSWVAVLLACALVLSSHALAVSPQEARRSSSGLDLVDVDLMFVGAHPDDESGVTATIARYVLDEGFKATVVTLTMGEGGGNATGPEYGASLGLIRAEELRRSLETVGVKTHYFLGLLDFYYTLFAEETQKRWGERFICDLVRLVRLTRPEVLVTMWPGPGTHGHHQMAARAATVAYRRAGDPTFCPEHIADEFLQPFSPLKLYYYAPRPEAATISIPTDDFSRSAYMRYADLKALALANFRSQGFDRSNTVPVAQPRPERFMLVASRVPIANPERHLLEGALLPAGESPPGVLLEVEPEVYLVGVGRSLSVRVTLTNRTAEPMVGVSLGVFGPTGWAVESGEPTSFAGLAPGQSVNATFRLSVPDAPGAVGPGTLWGWYSARWRGESIHGQNRAYFEVTPPVRVAFQPLFDIAGYRDFARQTVTEWVIPVLPARIPVTVGVPTPVTLELANRSDRSAPVRLSMELPPGVQVLGADDLTVPPLSTQAVEVQLLAQPSALPTGRQSAAVSTTVVGSAGGYTSRDRADVFLLPTLTVPRLNEPPVVDGDLADMAGLASGRFSHLDVWEGAANDDADSSGVFYVGYDESRLYVGVRVYDDSVICNIPPDDIRGHWRSDSVEITVDPSGHSSDTSTTFKTGVFPCTTQGFEARAERDADANQGPIERTAPGMRVASRRLDDGYAIEVSIPWAVMPAVPSPGDLVGFNVLVYDGDLQDARPGANINESRIGWASVLGAQQATPYVWPKVRLER